MNISQSTCAKDPNTGQTFTAAQDSIHVTNKKGSLTKQNLPLAGPTLQNPTSQSDIKLPPHVSHTHDLLRFIPTSTCPDAAIHPSGLEATVENISGNYGG